ncbi:MAG: sulfurtransferase TusA family protein [Candidatus Helarchaeota archaeon]
MENREQLNVKGKTCPMPVLLTRKKIREVGSGKLLEIIGDFQPAKINIRKFLEKEGHKILEFQDDASEYKFLIKIS